VVVHITKIERRAFAHTSVTAPSEHRHRVALGREHFAHHDEMPLELEDARQVLALRVLENLVL
jgi:hypothetical protein